MAAEDGMLMNFDISSISTLPIHSSKPAYKGGRWTDRVRAKRAAQYWEKKQKLKEKEGNGAATTSGDGHAKETKVARSQAEEFNIAKTRGLVGGPGKGNKRKRGGGYDATMDVNEEEESGEKNTRPAQRQKSARDGSAGKSQNKNSSSHAPPAPGGSGQFISSLWTYNPATTITTGTTTVEVDDTPQEPTNAPLSDGSATFTTLGLSASVSTHLTTKLNLKAPTAIQKAAIPELLTSDSDIFIQAQTGSGKTLTYLLPILDRISAFSATQNIKLDRSSGLFALILAPTRELAAQILAVLTQLNSSPAHHWITPTCVTGGEKRKSEKARLRKGCNILIATPGRLLDHLEMTESLDVSQVRWMVMDEGDRLADQGFEKEIAKIVDIVSKRSKISPITGDQGKGGLPTRRVTILCSATMGAGVQKLGDISLQDASFIKADDKNNANVESPDDETGKDKTKSDNQGEEFLAPAQLRQSYLLVPPKQRYVALYAMLKRAFMRASANMKVIVFFSCADSVDFHFEAFSRSLEEDRETEGEIGGKKDSGKKKNPTNNSQVHPTIRPAPLLHDKVLLCKLHGSLPQVQRTETLRCFTNGTTPSPPKPKAKPAPPTTPATEAPAPAEAETEATPSTPSAEPKPKSKLKPPKTSHPALLFSTDVSSRGLDLPNVDLIIQFDPPFSRADYIHRIGRTARAGRPGRAVIFLLAGTGEINYVERVIQPTLPNGGEMEGNVKGKVKEESIRDIFEKGFAPPSSSPNDSNNKLNSIPAIKKANTKKPPLPAYEHLATDFQLSLESWLYSSASTSPTHPLNLAKRAWTSHVRAYATHESSERDIFDKGKLQLGHLAKGFGLRERPGSISSSVAVASTSRATTGKDKRDKRDKKDKDKSKLGKIIGKVLGSEDEDEDDQSPQQSQSKINSKKRKPKWDQEDRVGTRFVGGGDVAEARERMRMLARGLQSKNGAAAEFNIG